MQAKNRVEELELFVPEEPCERRSKIPSNSRSLNDVDMEKVLNVCHPQIQQTILHCLNKKKLMFHIFGENVVPKSCFAKYPELSFSSGETSQRLESSQGFGITPSLASSSSTCKVPNFHPPSSPYYSGVKPTTGRHLSGSPNPPKKNDEKKKNNKEKDSMMVVVIAVVVTIMIILSVVGLILLCCCKALAPGSERKNDGRPLLSLSLSDCSSPSSSSYSFGASSINKKPGNLSFADDPNHKDVGDNLYKVNSLSNSKNEIPLEVGNGTDIVSAGLPPLKPPPGRPSISKPPSGKSAAPPPPPPVVSNEPPPPVVSNEPPPPPLLTKPSSGPPPPPPPSGKKNGPPPPPPPRKGGPPLPPPMGLKPPRSSAHQGNQLTNDAANDEGADASRTKLKPFFWDKVQANPGDSMVWNQLKAGSFQFNEEMIETLFGYAPVEKSNLGGKKPSASDKEKETIQILEPKKAQNLAILLKALNVTTEEVCDALQEGNELPMGLLQTLLKMSPTPEEEIKLRLYNDDVSRLGNAERFLKVVIEIPFAFLRLESLLFMSTLQEEEPIVRDSLATLEDACTALRKNRLFLKLLEAVLKTGNRMNDGTFRGAAQAFKLDTLLKLSDVKGKDGKTTLLHFVVQEIVRTEGVRAFKARKESRSFNSIKSEDLQEDFSEDSEDQYIELGLQVVSRIGNDLSSVKKAAILDSDGLTGTVAKFGESLIKAKNFLNSEMKSVDEENGFNQAFKGFIQEAEAGIMQMLEEEKRIMALVKSTADYFHGTAGKEEGLRIFVIVRDFLLLIDKVCKEIKVAPRKSSFRSTKREDTATPSQPPSSDPRQRLAPKIAQRRVDSSSSSSDEET